MELFSIRLKNLCTFESGVVQLVEGLILEDGRGGGGGGGGGKGKIPTRTCTMPGVTNKLDWQL